MTRFLCTDAVNNLLGPNTSTYIFLLAGYKYDLEKTRWQVYHFPLRTAVRKQRLTMISSSTNDMQHWTMRTTAGVWDSRCSTNNRHHDILDVHLYTGTSMWLWVNCVTTTCFILEIPVDEAFTWVCSAASSHYGCVFPYIFSAGRKLHDSQRQEGQGFKNPSTSRENPETQSRVLKRSLIVNITQGWYPEGSNMAACELMLRFTHENINVMGNNCSEVIV